MSNWLSKSQSSMKAAGILNENFANQSVHCSYYGCVQYIYHLMLTQMNEEERDLNDGITKRKYQDSMPKVDDKSPYIGTHVWLQKELYRSLRSRGDSSLDIDSIISDLGIICGVRVIADYKSEIIPSQRAIGIQEKASLLINKLETIY